MVKTLVDISFPLYLLLAIGGSESGSQLPVSNIQEKTHTLKKKVFTKWQKHELLNLVYRYLAARMSCKSPRTSPLRGV